jgi:hypothetical protein
MLDFAVRVGNNENIRKCSGFGGVSMAGNSNSGKSIPFRMSEEMLEKKIKQFRNEYGEGQHGMVTWPQFCDFIGYSEREVMECYVRGKEGDNAYSGRARLLEMFRTAVKGLTMATCNKQQQLATKEAQTDYLTPPGQEDGPPEVRIIFGTGDDRWIEAMR